MVVRVGWFKIAIITLGCIAVLRGCGPAGVENGRGFDGFLSGSGPTTWVNPLR
jgi:hypothetical protein